MMLTGTASTGMSVARQLCRKRNTTSVTSTIASSSVLATSSIDGGDERRGVERNRTRTPRPESSRASSFMRATTACLHAELVGAGRG